MHTGTQRDFVVSSIAVLRASAAGMEEEAETVPHDAEHVLALGEQIAAEHRVEGASFHDLTRLCRALADRIRQAAYSPAELSVIITRALKALAPEARAQVALGTIHLIRPEQLSAVGRGGLMALRAWCTEQPAEWSSGPVALLDAALRRCPRARAASVHRIPAIGAGVGGWTFSSALRRIEELTPAAAWGASLDGLVIAVVPGSERRTASEVLLEELELQAQRATSCALANALVQARAGRLVAYSPRKLTAGRPARERGLAARLLHRLLARPFAFARA